MKLSIILLTYSYLVTSATALSLHPGTTTTSSSNTPSTPATKNAIVVGAGPIGLATALILSSPRHAYNVTLLESSPQSTSQSNYDPTKAFLYNVNSRGQVLTRMFPNMHKKLEERSVPSRGFADTTVTVVPSDPGVDIPEGKKNVEGAVPKKNDGGVGSSSGSVSSSSSGAGSVIQSEKAVGVGYWIPRHEMVKLMVECVEEHNQSGQGGKITFLLGEECVSISPPEKDDANSGVLVTTKKNAANGNNPNYNNDTPCNHDDDGGGEIKQFRASLVVGADGMNSKVRECLAQSSSSSSSSSSTNTNNKKWSKHSPSPKQFIPKKYTSPASYLRIKVLQLPPRFQIPNGIHSNKPPLTTTSENIYAIRSTFNGPRNYLSLGLLPMKDNTAVRPTNIITRPDHEIWKITNGKEMKEYFQRAFPRFDFSKEDFISMEEWERFAKAEGTRFPPCQYSRGLAVWTEEKDGEHNYDGDDNADATTNACGGGSGVVLVGDAIHAFSPDIGQGVNAGLMDVVCLDRALCGLHTETGKEIVTAAATKPSIPTSLRNYQKQHSPEIAALIRLARFGAPYQYKQPHRIDRIRTKLWAMNLALRLVLNKLTFGLVQNQCILLSQNADLTFRQVMRRADLTTVGLRSLVLVAVGMWMKKRFGLGFLTALLG